MLAAREFPPNPHALIIHTRVALTGHIVETYLRHTPGSPPWVGTALANGSVRVISLNRYKVRVQKHKDRDWHEVLGCVEGALMAGLGILQVCDLVEHESRRRSFCWHGTPFERRVFEGQQHAAGDPVAGALFDLDGTAEVILDGNKVEVRKGLLFPWAALATSVESTLMALTEAATTRKGGP